MPAKAKAVSQASLDKAIARAVAKAVPAKKKKKTGGVLIKKRSGGSKSYSAEYYGAKGSGLRAIGSEVGGYVGALASKILGYGKYTMKKNSMLQFIAQNSELSGDTVDVPFMHSTKDGVRVRHREFISDLSGSILFANTTYSMNPGLSESFPWLSAIAQNFEEYRFEGLVFEFKSTSSNALNSTNTALGTVVLAAEYNTAQAAYINKQQMENSMWASSTKPACSLIMPVECSPALNPLANQYVRTDAVPTGQDIRMYDLCNVQVATIGMQAAAVIGELWVSYDVVLLKPQLSSGLNLQGQSAHYQLTGAVGATPIGTSRTNKFDSIGLTVSNTAVTFPKGCQGNYSIDLSWKGDSTAVVSPTVTLTQGCAALLITDNDTTNGYATGGVTSTRLAYQIYIYIADPNIQAIVTMGTAGTLPANPTAGDLIVNQMNGNLNS